MNGFQHSPTLRNVLPLLTDYPGGDYGHDVNPPISITNISTNWKFIPAPTYLDIPTSYAPDEQCLHPSVVYIPQGWGQDSRPYWMAFTPLSAAGTNDIENPEIVSSVDGVTWAVPAGLTNPIAPEPTNGGFNSDVWLVVYNDTMYCFWRESSAAVGDLIYYKTSNDGVTWSAAGTILTNPTQGTLANPIVVHARGVWHLWYLDTDASPHVLCHRTSTHILSGYGAAETCTLNGLSTETWWHGCIRYTGSKFFTLVTCDVPSYGKQYWVATSEDGVTWNFDIRHDGTTWSAGAHVSLYSGVLGAWDAPNGAYTPSIIWNPHERSWDVWYSWVSTGPEYWIGKGKLLEVPRADYDLGPLNQTLQILGPECVAFWPFFENSGTTVRDYSINGHDLTPTEDLGLWDTAPTRLSASHCLSFNSIDEGLSLADHDDWSMISGGDDIAFSAGMWIRSRGTGNDLIGKYDSGNSFKEWRIYIDGSKKLNLVCYDQAAGASERGTTSAAIPEDEWHFVVVTRDATQGDTCSDGFKFYVDGVLVSNITQDAGVGYTDMQNLGAGLAVGFTITSAPAAHLDGEMALPWATKKEMSAWEVHQLHIIQKPLMSQPLP